MINIESAKSLRDIGLYGDAVAMLREILAERTDDVEALIELGHTFRQHNDPDGALSCFKQALAARPNLSSIHADIGYCLQELGRLEEAEKAFRRAIRDAPGHIWGPIGLGCLLRRRGESVTALACYRQAVAAHPGSAEARAELAGFLRDLGLFDEAEALLRQSLADAPVNVCSLVGLAHLLVQRGDPIVALEYFERAVAAKPGNIGARVELGVHLRNLGRLAEATALFRRILAKAPTHIGALVELGHTLRQHNDPGGAMSFFRQALAANPNLSSIHADIGYCLQELGCLDEAESALRRSMELAPGHIWGPIGLGHLLSRRGDRTAALACFQWAVAANPASGEARTALGVYLRDLGRFTEAEFMLREVLAEAPGHLRARIELGHLLRQRGDLIAALDCFEQAVAASPGHPGARVELGVHLRAIGQLAEAMTLFRRILVEAPMHMSALIELGHTLRQHNDPGGALSCFQQALANSNIASVNADIGFCLQELGRFAEAEIAFRRAIQDAPSHIWGHIGLGHLLLRRGDHAVALACFQQAVAANPGAAEGRTELAACWRHLGRFLEAEALLRRVLADWPDHVSSHFMLVRMLAEQFRLDEARTALRAMQERAPTACETFLALGEIERKLGNRALALAHFKAAAAAKPQAFWGQLELASELADMGDFVNAELHIDAILDADPNNFAALSRRACVFRRQGNHEASFLTLQSAWRQHPHQLSALVEMAMDARTLGRPDQFRSCLDLALDRNPNDLSALLQSAEFALVIEDVEAALKICRRARKLYPANPHPVLLAARALAERANMREAYDLIDEGVQTLGPLPELRALRIEFAMRSGDMDLAQSLVTTIEGDAEHSFVLWAKMLRFAIDTARYDAARKAFLRLPPMNVHEQAAAAGFQGEIEEGEGHYALALEYYERALALNRHSHVSYSLARTSLLHLDVAAAEDYLKRSLESSRTDRVLRGEPMRISQSHFGQMLEEYVLDETLLLRLSEIARDPWENQIAPLRALVADNPDHTPTAIRLLVALRQTGDLNDRAPSGAEVPPFGRIPKRIAQYWDEAPPADVVALMRSWTDKNPDCDYCLFSDKSAREFMAAHCPPAVLKAYVRTRQPAQRADIFRLAYLSVEGGLYADADDRCLVPLSVWLPTEASFVGYQEDYGTMANNLLAAAPAHPVITRALKEATQAILRGDNDSLWLSTGPGLLTRAFAAIVAQDENCENVLKHSWIAQMGTMRRKAAIHCALGYKKSDRHWSRSNIKIKMQLSAIPRLQALVQVCGRDHE